MVLAPRAAGDTDNGDPHALADPRTSNSCGKRLDLIASNPSIRLLEKPEYKRRWAQEPWEKRQERALREWLLDRLEDRRVLV